MHLLFGAMVAEGLLCLGGALAMLYWRWRAVPAPYDDFAFDFESPSEPLFRESIKPIETIAYSIIKRAIDLVLALFMLAIFAVPGCVIALLIVSTSRGPVFYKEKRIGQYGYFFSIWKFRSMYKDAERRSLISRSNRGKELLSRRMCKSTSDPRITRVGHFLRKWSVDELPQILNVIKGDMSFIGPRPIVEVELSVYGTLITRYVEVKPGISGLWQVSGRSNIGYKERAELDAQYVSNWSLKEDFRMILRTIPAVLTKFGAR